jgi:hypothetical protein
MRKDEIRGGEWKNQNNNPVFLLPGRPITQIRRKTHKYGENISGKERGGNKHFKYHPKTK